MTCEKDFHFETAEAFLDYFWKQPRLKTMHEYSATDIGRNGFIFRGQANAKWKLTPSAFRDGSLREFSPQTAGRIPTKKEKLRAWLGWQLHAELRALFMFLETADRLGIPTPIDYTNMSEHYELINAAMNDQESKDFDAPFPSARRLNELSLAQHYGVPTRLLDWTESPYIAAFFAAYNASSLIDESSRIKSDKIIVFMFHVGHDSEKYREALMIANAPRHGNSFLRAQKGLFMHMPKANKYLLDNKAWPSVEDLVSIAPNLGGRLSRVTLPSSKSRDLLRALFDMDISRHSLMPSLDNAARACSYKLSLFR